MRTLKKQSILENFNGNELTSEEIKQEEKDIETAIPDAFINVQNINKKGKEVFFKGEIKIDNNVINFTFKLEQAVISTDTLIINDTTIKILNDINNYYKSWKGIWVNKINTSDNQDNNLK